MVNDTLSDVLTRIRNGCLNHSQTVSIPLTRLSQQICHTLEKEGFIESFQRDTSSQTNQRFVEDGGKMTSEVSQWGKGRSPKAITKSDILIVQLKYSEKKEEGVRTDNQIRNPIKNSQALSKKRSCITNLKRISKPGLRVYTRHKQIPTVLGGLGILILSTPKGVMTDREARFRKVGGEILCSVW